MIGVWDISNLMEVVFEEVRILRERQGSCVPTAHADEIGDRKWVYRAVMDGSNILWVGRATGEDTEILTGGAEGGRVHEVGTIRASRVILFKVRGG